MTENIVTGKKYRILTDAANDIWDRISFWSKASDVQYDDNTTAEANKAVAILKRNASYTVGTVAYEPSAPSWVLLKCTQAGTTSAVIPSTYSTISAVGTVITDGTARFTVYDVRPSGTLSNSEYQVPAMSLVSGLDSELTANGNKFYFDYQNSKYGYNTSASREAASFVPFGGTDSLAKAVWYGVTHKSKAPIITYDTDSFQMTGNILTAKTSLSCTLYIGGNTGGDSGDQGIRVLKNNVSILTVSGIQYGFYRTVNISLSNGNTLYIDQYDNWGYGAGGVCAVLI